MMVVGLTGGVASGKSSIAALFARRGVPVVDTDRIARELADREGILTALRQRFGPAVQDADGGLDRATLRRHVFADAGARRDLEAILHPAIRAEVRVRLDRLPRDTPWALLVVPLLVETGGWRPPCARVVVVDCPESLQLERLLARDDVDAGLARAMLAAQAGRDERLAAADHVLVNDGLLPEAAVTALDRHFSTLGQAGRQPAEEAA